MAPLALAGLLLGTPAHPTQLSVDAALRLAGALSPGSPQAGEDRLAAPLDTQQEQHTGPDTLGAHDSSASPSNGYTYDSPDGFSVTFPGEPEITEIPDPLGGNDMITLATYQGSDVFYQASFSGNPAARLTASDSARGSAAGIGADIASSVPLNLPGVDAVATEVTLGEEPAWLLNAVVASPDGVFVLIQGGTPSRDDVFFESFTINRQK